MPLVDMTEEKAAKWEKLTLAELMDKDMARIESIMSVSQLGEWYRIELEDMHRELYTQLAKSLKMGKLLQDMLLEFMTPAELKSALRDRMLKIDAADMQQKAEL